MTSKKNILVFVVLSITLYLGFIFNEDSSGGAELDYEYLLPYINNFYNDFDFGLKEFVKNSGTLIHSPAFYIIVGYLLRITENLLFVKVVYLNLSLLLPFLFYLVLKEKYKTKNNTIFYLSLLIFFSPYFRSSAIWLLGDNLALIFFTLSILFFLKVENKKNIKYLYLSIISLILCCYIRYYYCIFYVFYIYFIISNLKIKYLINTLILSFCFSIPALLYFFYILDNSSFLSNLKSFGTLNFLSSSLVILTIILFYIIPFILNDKSKIFFYYKRKPIKILIFFIISIIIYFLDKFYFTNLIFISDRGGGVFIKFFELLNFKENLLVIIAAILSLLLLDYLFKKNRFNNYILLLTLFCSLPILTIYQKYLDPLFLILLFGLFKSDNLSKLVIEETIAIKYILFYFFSFYIFSVLYYLR